MGPIYSIDDFIDMVRRRAPVMLLVIGIGCALSVYVALSRQHLYRSVEIIQVAQPKISDDLAKSTVEGSLARRLQLIEQRLLARDNVIAVIAKHALFADRPGLGLSEQVALVRRAVRIEGVAAAREGFADDGSMSILQVSAEMASPETAQLLAREFAESTIRLSRGNRIEQARGTLDFLVAQEQSLGAQIAAIEAEIAAFRNSNDLALPGSVEFRRAEIARINDELLVIGRELIRLGRASEQVDGSVRPATAERLRADIAEQMATIEAQRQLLLDRRRQLEETLETSPEIDRQLGAYARRLQQFQEQLSVVSARRSEAEVGFRLESDRQSEHLMVLEPAGLPEYPFTGSRRKIAVLGGALSVVAGFVLAFLLELRNPVIRSAAQMERELGFLPVVSVPVMDTSPRHGSRARRLLRRGGPGDRAGSGTPA